MASAASGPLSGSDRIELLEIAGRPVRLGSPAALAVSDTERVLEAFASKDLARVEGYLNYLHPSYVFMVAGSLEWAVRWPAFVAAERSREDAVRLSQRVHETMVRATAQAADSKGLIAVLAPEEVLPPAVERVVEDMQAAMTGGSPGAHSLLARVLSPSAQSFANVLDGLKQGRLDDARRAFERFVAHCRDAHDLLIDYVWAYASAVQEAYGQPEVERALEATFHSCSFMGPLRELVRASNPEQRAALLAEHLRHHFSGPDRSGAVQIIEEEDRYRLIFDACGSGGAARRRLAKRPLDGFARLPEASAATWGRAGEVPAYCAHCAINERVQVEDLGYPAWVTEFDPDPSKPCGWTVYKNPHATPERYFVRIGKKKPTT